MSDVTKIYRVSVRYPYSKNGRGLVKYGTKRMVSAMWRNYRDELAQAARHGRDTGWCFFNVAVAPLAVFMDISALYEDVTTVTA